MEFKKLCDILVDILHVSSEEISPDASFVEDLSADSLDLFEITKAVEETFEIQFSTSDTEGVFTVDDLMTLIRDSRIEY